jgi:hypothetical protein
MIQDVVDYANRLSQLTDLVAYLDTEYQLPRDQQDDENPPLFGDKAPEKKPVEV